MGLRLKFNLVMLLVFAVGMGVSAWVSHSLLDANAKQETLRSAGLMMESALSVRGYTVKQVKPLLEAQLSEAFPPQTVPAYAATEIFGALRVKYPDFTYKEAALNPTNPRDRAVEWESDLIQKFRADPAATELTGERETLTGRMLYLARPITINDAACLQCHSVPAAAPASMIRIYGPNNGFGWQLKETIGAQVVSVPMSVPLAHAQRTFNTFMLSLGGIFVAVFVVLNLMLTLLIIGPISRLSTVADRVSTGDFNEAEFPTGSGDEIGKLAASFNRMRRSLQKAIKLIDT
jgi:HAMP domain-containing protein